MTTIFRQTQLYKFLQYCEEYRTLSNRTCSVGVSIGIGMYPEDGRDIETLLQKADAARYRLSKIVKIIIALLKTLLRSRSTGLQNTSEAFSKTAQVLPADQWHLRGTIEGANRKLSSAEPYDPMLYKVRTLSFIC